MEVGDMWRRLGQMAVRALLLPIIPGFQWGAFTHPYINQTVLAKCASSPDKVKSKRLASAVQKHAKVYVYAANSPDAISTNHVLRNHITYDYAHNYIPDLPGGRPVFGYKLVAEALKRLDKARSKPEVEKCQRDLAFACGWLSHQIADWVPHHRPCTWTSESHREFKGYANSHQILVPEFHPDLLAVKEIVEHGIIELLHDAYIILTDTSGSFKPGCNHCGMIADGEDNIVTAVSESFVDLGYSRIAAGHIPSLRDDFDAVICGLDSAIILLAHLQPRFKERVISLVEKGRLEYVEESVDHVFQGIFSLDEDEIKARAEINPEYTEEMEIRVVPRRESVLQQWGFRLGRAGALAPKTVAAVCDSRSAVIASYRTWFFRGEVRYEAAGTLRQLLLTFLGQL